MAPSVPPWVELPREITAAILHKLGAVEILTTAQNVCTTWRRVCRDPAMWRRIHIPYSGDLETTLHLDRMCRHAVDLSQGHLTDISIEFFGSDDLLLYISQRSSQLRRLQLTSSPGITGGGLCEAVKNLPLLENLHLHINNSLINEKDVENVGLSCPLKSFALNGCWSRYYFVPNVVALAIARSMPQLRHLQLLGNVMTNKLLEAIFYGCQHLESLDLRKCCNVRIDGDLERLLSQRIKDLRLPDDPLDDYPFPGVGYDEFYGIEDDDDDDDGDDDKLGSHDVDLVCDYFGSP
ncbi:putative F-box/LRR-repeat protein 23 [Phtheirospermum japonicum]|uniref:Putative F-box/LRR-repeat protein 23 n=1 Tax=Phtheirospermum japonicum TaxID=374723 RepID=A0A830CLC5_9LAMI|nr:putative F-box/LRR-repeat protein 23 [Phtheirospermum japonicum]